MGSEASGRMLSLLLELSQLKASKQQMDANPSESDREAQRKLDRRHEEITQEIKELGEQKKEAKAD